MTLASNFGGFLAAASMVMALIARQRSGKGQRIDVPLYNAMFTLIGPAGAYPTKRGVRYPGGIHGRGAGCFRCGDGRYVQFDTSSARHLTWFANEAGINAWGPDLLDPERLRNPENNQRLHAALRELFLTKSAEEWEDDQPRAGGAMGFCRTTTEWLHTDHAQASKAVVAAHRPGARPDLDGGAAVRSSKTRPGAPRGPRHLPAPTRRTCCRGSASSSRLGMRRHRARESAVADGRATQSRRADLAHAVAGHAVHRPLRRARRADLRASAGRVRRRRDQDQQPQGGGMSGYLNRGKRTHPARPRQRTRQQVFWKLVEDADIVLENFSPGTADRLGIGYEQAKARKPDIVYSSAQLLRPGRPLDERPRLGAPGAGRRRHHGAHRRRSRPILGPYNLIDVGTGVMGTFATALGVYHRLRSGKGQHVHGSLAHTATYQQAPYMLDYKGHVSDEPRGYEALGTGPLQRFYQASDGWFFLARNAGGSAARHATSRAAIRRGRDRAKRHSRLRSRKGTRDELGRTPGRGRHQRHVWVRLHELMAGPLGARARPQHHPGLRGGRRGDDARHQRRHVRHAAAYR